MWTFFTLNQDVVIEIGFANSESKTSDFDILGFEKEAWFLDSVLKDSEANPILLPDHDAVEKIKSSFLQSGRLPFVYLKLHGSYGWQKKDGSDAMVIGDSKTKAIADEPLLRWYHDLFQETLLREGQKLVVIGYGFGDSHINGAIADGIRKSRLRLHIVNPMGADALRDRLMRLPIEQERRLTFDSIIWEGLGGYHQGTVCNLYNRGSGLTHEGKTFLKNCGLIS